ncbi:MAG: glycosyltransferase [Actinomycetota bacterium]|nr:glycosyltransferase [Actinomycetota bacterium]
MSERNKYLTFIGYLSERKNQKYLCQVMEYLPENFILNLIGAPINPEYLEELKDYVQKKELKNVNFIGDVPYEKIPGLLEKTHVFVSASKMEVQSLVIIEALASGTPVIGLSNETVNEFVDDSVGFRLKKQTSPADFAENVKKICSLSQREYEILCNNAKRRVVHLNWPDIVKQTEKAYQKLIKMKEISNSTEEKGMDNKISDDKEVFKTQNLTGFRAFLNEKIKKPAGKIIKNKNITMFIMTVTGTFFLRISYCILSKTKRITDLK